MHLGIINAVVIKLLVPKDIHTTVIWSNVVIMDIYFQSAKTVHVLETYTVNIKV